MSCWILTAAFWIETEKWNMFTKTILIQSSQKSTACSYLIRFYINQFLSSYILVVPSFNLTWVAKNIIWRVSSVPFTFQPVVIYICAWCYDLDYCTAACPSHSPTSTLLYPHSGKGITLYPRVFLTRPDILILPVPLLLPLPLALLWNGVNSDCE